MNNVTPGFGYSALAVDVMLQLIIELVCQRDPDFKTALLLAIDELLKSDAPPAAVKSALSYYREQVAGVRNGETLM